MKRAPSRLQELYSAGYCKVSYIIVIPGAAGHDVTMSKTAILESLQEWEIMKKAYYNDPCAGHLGEMLVIPKGVTVAVLRLETPPGAGVVR